MGPKKASYKKQPGEHAVIMDSIAKATSKGTAGSPEKRRRKSGQMQDAFSAGSDVRSIVGTTDLEQIAMINEKVGQEAKIWGLGTNAAMSLDSFITEIHQKLDEFGQASRIALSEVETEYASKLAAANEELGSVEGRRDEVMSELAEQQAQVKIESDKKRKLQKAITKLEQQKKIVEQNLLHFKGEEDKWKKSELAQKRALEEANNQCERVRKQYKKQHLEIQRELLRIREEKNQLTSSLETMRKSLEDEKEKAMCNICLESPKDTMCFPCSHLQYCFPCLEKHRKQSNSCPTCRTTISGIVKYIS